jgi:hypothetical protein
VDRQHSGFLGVAICAGASWLALALAGLAQMGGVGQFKGFKLTDFYDARQRVPGRTNLLKSLVIAREAYPQSNGLILLTEMRMESYQLTGQTNVIARSPECLVDTQRRMVFSAGHLQLESGDGQLFIEGDGFLCRLTNFTLNLTNNVRTVIRRGPLESHLP